MSYDIKCYELAEAFLADVDNVTPNDKDVLAQRIQQTIEDYIKYELEEEPKP